MINFDDDRFHILSDHDVKPKDVEAHVSFVLLRLAVSILVADAGQPAYDCFNDSIFNFQF